MLSGGNDGHELEAVVTKENHEVRIFYTVKGFMTGAALSVISAGILFMKDFRRLRKVRGKGEKENESISV